MWLEVIGLGGCPTRGGRVRSGVGIERWAVLGVEDADVHGAEGEIEDGQNSGGDGRRCRGCVVVEAGRAQAEGESKRLLSSLSQVGSGRGGPPVMWRVTGWTTVL